MAITQVASYTPTDRRPQAFALGSPAALEVNNKTTFRLVCYLGRNLRTIVEAGDHMLYIGLNNLTIAATAVLVSPINYPDSASQLAGTVDITSYAVGDVLPTVGVGGILLGSFTVPARTRQDQVDLTRTLDALNLRDFGAVGDGVTDDGPALQAALGVLQVFGGGILYLPSGTYLCSTTTNPENSSYFAAGFIAGNTRLIGDGINDTIIKLHGSAPDNSHVLMNWHIATGGDENISIEDLTIDGNAQNQTMTAGAAGMGLKTLRTRNLRCTRVRFKDVYGTAGGGSGEGFHTTFDLGTDAVYMACEAIGTTANTATGFSANQSTNIAYIGCTARNMGFGQGFTHNGCIGVSHVGCYSYLNGAAGFNSEVSNDVRYIACRAGGAAVNAGSYPYAAGQSLGNSGNGFVINGTVSIALVGCQSSKNAQSGVGVQSIASGAGVIQIIGGEYSNNGQYGVAGGFADVLKISGSAIITGNTTNQVRSASIDHPTNAAMSAAAIPASGTAIANPYSIPCAVTISGGTVTGIAINGVTVAGTSGTYYLQPGNTITLTYSVAPTWAWVGML